MTLQEIKKANKEKIIKSIERRFKILLNDCSKAELIIISIGDGGSLSIYNKDDIGRGNIDQLYGISDDNGNELEPIFSVSSKAIY